MTLTFWIFVGLATVTCLFMAWSLGANSNSPPFAPAIGARAVSTIRAAFLVGILAGVGAITQGGSISATVGQGLFYDTLITPLAATTGLLIAATFMALGVYTGYPVPAAFATTGAMIGVGLSLGGDPSIGTYRQIGTFWVLVPPMSGGIAFLTATLLRRDDIPETVGIPLLAAVVGGVLAHIRLGVIPHPERSQGSIAELFSNWLGSPHLFALDVPLVLTTIVFGAFGFLYVRRKVRASVERGIQSFLLILGGIVAFSSGGSQVGLATGPLEQLYGIELGLPSVFLLGIGATGILAGAWMGAPRLLQATSREYAQLGVRRSIAALVPGFIIAQMAIALGIPISFNNIIISGVIGGGLAAGTAGVSRRKIAVTIVFWLITLGASLGIGFVLYRLFSTVLGIE